MQQPIQRQELIRLLCAREIVGARVKLTQKSKDIAELWQIVDDLDDAGWSDDPGDRYLYLTEQEWAQVRQAGRDEKQRIYAARQAACEAYAESCGYEYNTVTLAP